MKVHTKINEEITVQGATFVGNHYGIDLFDILTWDAATYFVVGDTEANAGAFVQNQEVFERNINENQHLYFFTVENTNRVVGAAVKGTGNAHSEIQVFTPDRQAFVLLGTNFAFETTPGNNNGTDKPLPFYLIPGAEFNNITKNYYIINNNELKAALPQVTTRMSINVTEEDLEGVTAINVNAFNYGLVVNDIIIPENTSIVNIRTHTFDNVASIKLRGLVAPESWENTWLNGVANRIVYGYGLSQDDIDRRNREIAAEQERRAEAERAAEQDRLRREAELKRQREQQLIKDLRYKVEGKNITITGSRHNPEVLEIPEEIEGKPVTKIASYAFYGDENLSTLKVPSTLKLIEKGALEDTGLRIVRVPKTCIVSGNPNVNVRRLV